MKVIFLDIDGVLCVRNRTADKYGPLFHGKFVKNLYRIIYDTGAKIVISSSWRFSGEDKMMKMWDDRNLPGLIVGITPYLRNECRGSEIAVWLKTNPVEAYCIIDDDRDMLPEQMNNLVLTEANYNHPDSIGGYGLTKKCADMAIKILNQ